MNRRKLLAIGGAGVVSIAGCTALKNALLSEDTAAPSDGESNQEGESPDISADEVNSTDTPPEEREETTPETQPNESGNESSTPSQEPPDTDPIQAVEIAEHQMIFEEATDPQYEDDELYLQGMIRNSVDHPLQNVRLDGYAYSGDDEVGHEFLEYATLEAGGERRFELPFYVENPSAVERYEINVTAAEYA